jgi:hypothetical protein
METQYSLLIDTNLDKDDESILKRIYELLIPSDVSVNSETKEFMMNNYLSKIINDKKINYRFVQNFFNDKKSIEIFLKNEPTDKIIFKMKDVLRPIKEIIGYRLMTVQTKVKVEINTI